MAGVNSRGMAERNVKHMQSKVVRDRIAEIEQEVADGSLSRVDADRKIKGLHAMEKYADDLDKHIGRLRS